MKSSFRRLVVHSFEAKQLLIITGSPHSRPPRRPSTVRCKVDKGIVIVHLLGIALVSAESAHELEVQASKEWAVGRQASADDGHGWL